MIEVFIAGGYFMWPILVSGLLVIGLAARAAYGMARADAAARGELRSGIDAIVFWGGFGAVVGVLGTTGGIAQMARVLEGAGQASPGLVWGGIQVALITTVFGLSILVLSLLLWAALRARERGRGGMAST